MANISKEILTEILKNNICEVTFIKKDGTERVMKSTLIDEYIKPHFKDVSNEIKKERKENPNQVKVLDLDADDWRSFNADTVTTIKLKEVPNENKEIIKETSKKEVLIDRPIDKNKLIESDKVKLQGKTEENNTIEYQKVEIGKN